VFTKSRGELEREISTGFDVSDTQSGGFTQGFQAPLRLVLLALNEMQALG
jgi:hypothetical protein